VIVAARDVDAVASIAAILVILPPSCARGPRVTASTAASLLSLFPSTLRSVSSVRLSASLERYSTATISLSIDAPFKNVLFLS